jgi:uncharacterized protein YndB with AHSA1/START domain
MTAKPDTARPLSREFVITRVFDAPRDLVWKAFTQVEHLKHWWGPKGFKMLTCTLDLRVGGMFHYGMASPEGHEMWGKWTFREIDPPRKLVFISSFSDKQGGLTRHPMAPSWPAEMLGTTLFEDQGGKTLITNKVVAYNASEEERRTFEAGFESMKGGFGGTFDQLSAYLATL